MPGLGQGVSQGADDQSADQGGIPEADLGLGRMHVDVHPFGADVQEQGQHGVAIPGQQVLVGTAHGPQQRPVAHRAAIDEQILGLGIAAIEGGHPGVARQAHALALGIDHQGVVGEFPAHDLPQALQPRSEQVARPRTVAEDAAFPVR